MGERSVYLGRIYTPRADGAWQHVPQGYLVVGSDGRIEDIGAASDVLERSGADRSVDLGERLIMPGFIDCHQHICHYDWSRLIADLLTWLREIYSLELRFNDPVYAVATAQRFFSTLLENGTTSACVHGPYFPDAVDAAFDVARELGVRVIMGLNTGDLDLPPGLGRPAAESIADSVALNRKWDGACGGRLSYCFTVRPPYCASADLLAGMAQAAFRANARIQSHLSEDPEGQRAILRLFPEMRSDAQVFDSLGLFGSRSVMAHAIYLHDGDLDLLATRGASVVHCPRANLLAGGQQADLPALAAHGIPVGLGTDLGAGKGLSMFRAMEDALKVSPHLSVHDLFRMATLGGARALGLHDTVGSLEVGKDADFIVLAPPLLDDAMATRHDDSLEAQLASLVFRGDDRAVRHAFIAGALVASKESLPAPSAPLG